jgi:hypothetical protein
MVYPAGMAMVDAQHERLVAAVAAVGRAEKRVDAALDERDRVVQELHGEGVFDREMAPVLGLHPTQVGNIRKGNRSSAKRRKGSRSVTVT